MTDQLPEGIDIEDVKSLAMSIQIAGTLINLTSNHLTAEDGSPEEALAEQALSEYIENVANLGPENAGGVILALVSIVAQTGAEADVQAWFDSQYAHITAAMTQGSSDG